MISTIKWITLLVITIPLYLNAQIQIGSVLNGTVTDDQFGKHVSLSADGKVLVVLSDGTTNKVHVYKNIENNWELYGTDQNGGQFEGIVASGVDISGDGQTLALRIGGLAKVYTYNSGAWIQKGSDISMIPPQSTFGTEVDLSYDGNIIALGATNYVPSSSNRILPPPNYHGLVQVFKYDSSDWSQFGNDIVANAFDLSAKSYCLSSDGNIIAISNKFSIRVFEYDSGIWVLKGNDIIGEENDSKEVSISSDGSILIMSDPSYSDGIIQRGRVRIYQYISNDWMQIGNDILGQTSYEFAGQKVSMSSNGNVVAVSFNGNYSIGNNVGQVRIYKNVSGTWTQIGSNLNGESSQDRFGTALSLSSDASTVAIGTPFNDTNGADSGHVKVYDLSATLATYDQEISQFRLYPNPSTNQFTIQLPQGLQLQKVNVYSVLGRLVISAQEKVIQTKDLSQGVYLVEVKTDKGKSTKKLIVK